MLNRTSIFRYSALLITLIVLTSCSTYSGPEAIPPELVLPAKIDAIVGQAFTYNIIVSDPQGLKTELIVDGLPAWLEYIPASKSLQGTPGLGDEGRFELNIIAQNQVNGITATTELRVFTSIRELQLQNNLERFVSITTPGLMGISIAVVDADGILYTAYTGHMGNSTTSPKIQKMSMYRVASVTKPMTTAIMLKLDEEGRLNLSDRFHDHYTSSMPNGHIMTIRQMLSHTAGIFDHLNANSFWGHPSRTPTKVWSIDEIIGFAAANGPRFTPGTAYGYSNTGFCALGGIIEDMTEKPLREAFDEMLFGPLGLEESVYDDFSGASNSIENLALNSRSYEYHLSSACAAGAVAATASDVARFGWHLYGGRYVSSSISDLMSENIGARLGGSSYGLGTRIWTVAGIPHHGHTGALMDYRNILMYIPGLDISIAMHTHQVHPGWFPLTDDVFEYVVDNFTEKHVNKLPRFMWEGESRWTEYERNVRW